MAGMVTAFGIMAHHAMLDLLTDNLRNTSLAEVVAVVTGLLSVWYARKEHILVYPVGIVSVLIYVWLCYTAGLYADMGINAFYFLMSVYGWIKWRERDKINHAFRPISFSTFHERTAAVGITIVFTVLLFFLLSSYTDSTVPLLDSLATAIFIVAMWLMALKKIEHWIFWIAGDAICVFLFPYKGLVFSGFQYLVFLMLAISGYAEWKRRWKAALKVL
ncbi:MAG TPA: nicotinamide riboside transporter PnuC [Bacteroidales bacterium]|nr:nicotinamide riboside transporter PnuC [Bacteroidales bacterium]HSA43326.1 nicotinamide riboside transporter PnuC [Bacteroidales bacterium]